MNKTEQELTTLPKVNPQTGLTAIQEQCASLPTSGERVSDVADIVKESRTTTYQLKELRLQEEDQTGKRKTIGKDYDEESMNEDRKLV